ncbi:MAG: phosphate ABC transporter substrate-binding protein [Clostridiaceae bacterium]
MKKKNIKILISGLAVVLSLGLFAGCGTTSTDTDSSASDKLEGTVSVVGSTSVQPLAQAIADEFESVEPGIKIDIQGVGSTAGVTAIHDGTCDIGTASRKLKGNETGYGLDEHIIAYDGIGVVVNPSNKVSDLTTEQIKDIFEGKITNWSEVGGADDDILVVSREDGSGTRGAFEELMELIDSDKVSTVVANALIADSNGAVKANIASKENAIGYMSLGMIDDSVKKTMVDGIEATDANIIAGEYNVSRPFLMLTNGEVNEITQAYLDFIMSDAGQKIVSEEYITVSK